MLLCHTCCLRLEGDISDEGSLDAAQRNQGVLLRFLDYAALHQGYFPYKKPQCYQHPCYKEIKSKAQE